MTSVNDIAAKKGIRSALTGIVINASLAAVKATAGIIGNSYVLIADAIESSADVLTSLVVILGLRLSRKPADASHPYGHGKFEPLAAAAVSLTLMGAAILIAVESVHEIRTPHHAPAPFTLLVLVGVVILKEGLYRYLSKTGEDVGSLAIKSEAWHNRGDMITSGAAFIGISIALIGGEGYETADDFAALLASLVIASTAIILLRSAIYELIDSAPDQAIAEQVREVAMGVEGVLGTHKCLVRKLGFDHFVDLDVLCNPALTIREGHEIAHNVGEALHKAMPSLTKVLVHIEPIDDYGRRSRDNLGV